MIADLFRRVGRLLTGRRGGREELSADEATAEYHAEAANWELPDGRAWPAEPYAVEADDGKSSTYEAGTGRKDAQKYWTLAWYRVLAESTTAEERETAFAQITRLEEAAQRPEVEAAKAGDLAGLKRYLEANDPD